MSLGWKSAGLCLSAAFPPRAAACSHLLLPLQSSCRWNICCPEALLSLAAPSSSVGKGRSANYCGYRTVTKVWEQALKGSWVCSWISFLTWSIPAISKHWQLLLSFGLSQFLFLFLQAKCLLKLLEELLLAMMGMLPAELVHQRERSRKPSTLCSLSNSTLACPWAGQEHPSCCLSPLLYSFVTHPGRTGALLSRESCHLRGDASRPSRAGCRRSSGDVCIASLQALNFSQDFRLPA